MNRMRAWGVAIAVGLTLASCGDPTAQPRRQDTSTSTPAAAPETVGTWKPFDAGPLATRGEPKAVWTGTEMIVLGGLAIERYAAFDDGAAYDPRTGTWRRIANRPDPGRMLAAAWTGKEIFVLGQKEGIELENAASVHLYDPATDRWRAASAIPHPVSMPEAAYWTGREVIVWKLGSGLLYDPATDAWRELPPPSGGANTISGRALWFDNVKRFAVQGSRTPENGGALEDALWLFDPETNTWTAKPAPERVPQFNLLYGAWLGGEAAYEDVLYNPRADRWRKIPLPPVDRDEGTAYFTGVPIRGDRAALRIGAKAAPLLLFDSGAGTWSRSTAPASPPPAPDGVAIWDGRQVLLFGRANDARATDPNAAWAWTPPA